MKSEEITNDWKTSSKRSCYVFIRNLEGKYKRLAEMMLLVCHIKPRDVVINILCLKHLESEKLTVEEEKYCNINIYKALLSLRDVEHLRLIQTFPEEKKCAVMKEIVAGSSPTVAYLVVTTSFRNAVD